MKLYTTQLRNGTRLARWLAESPSRFALGATLLGLLTLMIPPTGILGDNEEHYFAAALHYVDPHADPHGSAVMGGMPHAFAFSWITGTLVREVGFEVASIVGRSLAIALYGLALFSLFSRLSLRPLDAFLVLGGFYLLGQETIGGEWLFRGFEPKVLAYPFVILAISEILAGRHRLAFLLLVAATWLHFLVGGFWAALLLAAMWLTGIRDQRLTQSAVVFAVLVAPMLWFLWSSGYGENPASGDGSSPSVGWIISHFRSPHHATPFGSPSAMLAWTPGVLLTVVLALLASASATNTQGPHRFLSIVVAAGCLYLLAALVATGLATGGSLGPYVVFRPSSLLLLVAMISGVNWLQRLGSDGVPVRMAAALLILAGAAPAWADDLSTAIRSSRALATETAPLVEFARNRSARDAAFLIEPSIERAFLGFERQTHRRVLVMHKFVPAASDEIVEWYRRRRFQDQLFETGCSPAEHQYGVDYLVASFETAERLSISCGPIALRSGRFALVAIASDTH